VLVDSALALSLDPSVDAREALKLIFTASRDAATRERAYQFTKSHHDALVARLPGDAGGALPLVGQGLCDAAREGGSSRDLQAELHEAARRSAPPRPGRGEHRPVHGRAPVLQPSLETFLAGR
jgi:hypothetical protein